MNHLFWRASKTAGLVAVASLAFWATTAADANPPSRGSVASAEASSVPLASPLPTMETTAAPFRPQSSLSVQTVIAAGESPVAIEVTACPVSPIEPEYAFRDNWGEPRGGGTRSHQGIDIYAPEDSLVFAIADGVVRLSDHENGGLGVHITTLSGNRYYNAHLNSWLVTNGQQVYANDPIGTNGRTGNARNTGAHVHFQFHPGGGAPINPYDILVDVCPPPQ